MLETRHRRLFLEALRPPGGYAFSEAVCTTFTLDLLSLLTAPLAFTMFDWEDADGRPQADPLALLESLRRHADNIHLFCQAGYVSVPPAEQRLLGWLEQSVIEVKKPDGGPFHPKVWVLRFTADGEPVLYRVLVSTRNLTFDRSWDTLLVLEGDVRDGESETRQGPALADFLTALPRLALRQPVAEQVQAAVDRVAREIRRTKFEVPEPFEDFRFQPLGRSLWNALGKPQKKHPEWTGFDHRRVDRLLVVSPFLSPPALRRMSEPGAGDILVSRADAVTGVPGDDLRRFGDVFVLAPQAEGEPSEAQSDGPTPLAGLHAKLYVADQGRYATIWTGSANATGSLFGDGVEFLVELRGTKGKCGVDAALGGADGQVGLRGLLQRYEVPAVDVPGDAVQRELERRREVVRTAVAEGGLSLDVSPGDAASAFRVRVLIPGGFDATIPAGAVLRVRPVTRARATAAPWPTSPAPAIDLGTSPFEGLTTFFAFSVVVHHEGRTLEDEFVVNLPATGMPADRRERLLRSALGDRRQVVRFLLLLLADSGLDVQRLLRGSSEGSEDTQVGHVAGLGEADLLESLLRALDRDPAKVDRVDQFVRDLAKAPDGAALLPSDLEGLLAPILEVRRGLAP
ncbi:MAG: phospholipase D family protein [Planctomycetes bacterium]|nr:phospholipase D family protein [Planctomycetota bacterium]